MAKQKKTTRKPAPKRATPAKRARGRDEEPLITKFGRSVLSKPKKPPMIPNVDGSWREYDPLPKGTRVQVAPDMMFGIVDSHTPDGIPMVRIAEEIDGALTGAMMKAREVEPMLLVVKSSATGLAHVAFEHKVPDVAKPAEPEKKRGRAKEQNTRSLFSVEMLTNPINILDDAWTGKPYACVICSVERDDENATAGTASLCSTLKKINNEMRVIFAWFCPAHSSLASGLRDRILAERIDTVVGWSRLFAEHHEESSGMIVRPDDTAMRALAKANAAAATLPDYDPADRVDCSHPKCPRWLVGKLLLGWYVYTGEDGKPRAFCHGHAKEGRIEFDKMSARVSPAARAQAKADLANADTISDDVSKSFDDTMKAIDGAIERASNQLAIPRGGYEVRGENDSEPPSPPERKKRGAKTKPVESKYDESRPYPCCVDGCDSTYFAHRLDSAKAIAALLGVPNPPEGWWIVEEGDPVNVRLAYCIDHRSLGEHRTKMSQLKASTADFEPELDDAPWSTDGDETSVDGQPDFPTMPNGEQVETEEAAPWD